MPVAIPVIGTSAQIRTLLAMRPNLPGATMAERIRNHDWAAPLGPLDTYSDVLKTTLALCLASPFPQAVFRSP